MRKLYLLFAALCLVLFGLSLFRPRVNTAPLVGHFLEDETPVTLTPAQRYEARRQAVRDYRAGKLTEAEAISQFREVLASIPRSDRALGYLKADQEDVARKQFHDYLREATGTGSAD